MFGSNVEPLIPLPDHIPTPRVEVVNAEDKLIVELGKQIGLIVPVIVDGTYCSTGTIAVVVCKQPAPPYT